MIIQPLTSCLDCKRKNGCICDCLKCSEELEETQQNYSRYGASVRTKGRFSHTFFFFFSARATRLHYSFQKKYHATRRNANGDDGEIYRAIQQELDGPGRMRGYRAMWYTHSIGLRNTGTKKNGGRNLRK